MWKRRTTRERELSTEIESHLDMHIADNLRAGMTADEARRQALVALGGVEPTKERYREHRRWRALDELARDAAFAVRMLSRDRGFTIMVAMVLGIGLAVTNTFFILTNAIALRGLPIDEPDRVLMVRARDAADRNLGASYPDYLDLRASAKASDIGAFTWAPMTLGDDAHAAERFTGAYVSSNLFALIGERRIAGRDFQPQDDMPGAAPVVILGRSIWESRYGGSGALIGSTLRVNGVPSTVVGIMPDHSKFPSNAVVWLPLGALPANASGKLRGSRQLDVFGRLKPGVSRVDAIGELQGIWSELVRRYPATNANVRLLPIPANHNYIGERIHPGWFALLSAGFLVLGVACANVANLLVMRGTHRAREIAVRTSLGATRARIVRQLLAESLVLAFVGGTVGLVLSIVTARLLWITTPEGMLPHWMYFAMDPMLFGLLAAVCLGSAVLFGLVPAFQISKGALSSAMSNRIRGTSHGVPTRRLTSALLIAQFAVALGSLISISAAARSVADDFGLANTDASGILTMSIALPGDRYATPESRIGFYDRLRRHFEQVGGVTQLAFTSNLPVGGAATRGLILEGHDAQAKGPRPTIRSLSISPEYFDTLGLPLLRGRQFTDRDGVAEPAAVIINQRLADLYFAGADPVGKPLTVVIDSAPRRFTIVGVSPSVKQRPGPQADPVVYFPHRATAPAQMSAMIRRVTDRASTAEALRSAMQTVDADIPLYRLMTLEEAIDESAWNARFSNIILNVTAMLAVMLSAIGLFALTAHAVASMTPEIGIRAALGARPHQVLDRVLRRAAVQVALGIAAGVAFAFAWDRIFPVSAARNIGVFDFVIAAVMLAVVSAMACLLPALRALRVNPVVALRYE